MICIIFFSLSSSASSSFDPFPKRVYLFHVFKEFSAIALFKGCLVYSRLSKTLQLLRLGRKGSAAESTRRVRLVESHFPAPVPSFLSCSFSLFQVHHPTQELLLVVANLGLEGGDSAGVGTIDLPRAARLVRLAAGGAMPFPSFFSFFKPLVDELPLGRLRSLPGRQLMRS